MGHRNLDRKLVDMSSLRVLKVTKCQMQHEERGRLRNLLPFLVLIALQIAEGEMAE